MQKNSTWHKIFLQNDKKYPLVIIIKYFKEHIDAVPDLLCLKVQFVDDLNQLQRENVGYVLQLRFYEYGRSPGTATAPSRYSD